MKRNVPAIIALALWLLFVVSNAFAAFKSAYPPDQSIVVGVGEDDHGVGSAARFYKTAVAPANASTRNG